MMATTPGARPPYDRNAYPGAPDISQRFYENLSIILAELQFLDEGTGPNTAVDLARKAAAEIKRFRLASATASPVDMRMAFESWWDANYPRMPRKAAPMRDDPSITWAADWAWQGWKAQGRGDRDSLYTLLADIVAADDMNSGAEPSASLLDRAIDDGRSYLAGAPEPTSHTPPEDGQ